MSSSSGDDGQASDAFNDDDDELCVKRRGASIRRSSLEMPAAGGTSSSREAATDKPSQLLGGTPLDHDEDTLSHPDGRDAYAAPHGWRCRQLTAVVQRGALSARRVRVERVGGGTKLARPLFGAPVPDGGIVVSESGGARLKVLP